MVLLPPAGTRWDVMLCGSGSPQLMWSSPPTGRDSDFETYPPSCPKQIVERPPGGACNRIVGRSDKTFPQFWFMPQAKAFDDGAVWLSPRQPGFSPGWENHTLHQMTQTTPESLCQVRPAASFTALGDSPRQIVDRPPNKLEVCSPYHLTRLAALLWNVDNCCVFFQHVYNNLCKSFCQSCCPCIQRLNASQTSRYEIDMI